MDEPAPVVGRKYLLARLADEMRFDRVIQLWGAPGIGKSTLLRHAARTLEPGPDGVVFLSAVPSGSELRALMKGSRATVYIDNADLASGQLIELTDAAGDATFVFASREAALRGQATVIEVPGLDLSAAIELLQSRLPYPLPPVERAGARHLWEVAGGNPLLFLRLTDTYSAGPGCPRGRSAIPGNEAAVRFGQP